MDTLILLVIFFLIIVSVPLIFVIAMGVTQARLAKKIRAEREELDRRITLGALSAATIVSARVQHVREAGEVLLVRLTLRIEPPDGETYTTAVNWEVDGVMEHSLQPGQPIAVKIDPQDPKRVYPNVSWARYSLTAA